MDRSDVTVNPKESSTLPEDNLSVVPFQDVIKTEAAPNLQTFVGDLPPYIQQPEEILHVNKTQNEYNDKNGYSKHNVYNTQNMHSKPNAYNTQNDYTYSTQNVQNVHNNQHKYNTQNKHFNENNHNNQNVHKTTQISTLNSTENNQDPNFKDEEFSLDKVFQFLFSEGEPTKNPNESEIETIETPLSKEEENGPSLEFLSNPNINPGFVTVATAKKNSTFSSTISSLELQENIKDESYENQLNNVDSLTPVGPLKLAGCNIYGRMYRVGKIIFELSGPCLECKCTEVGVQCKSLKC